MRTNARPQSVVRHPLSAIFATEAAVRVLRELSQSGHAQDPPLIAKRARISIHTVRRTLERLVSLGVVEVVGHGRYPSYRLAASHPLRSALDALFNAEALRMQAIFDGIRRTADSLPIKPEAVWMYGSVARQDDGPESDLDIAAVFPEGDVERAATAWRELLRPLEEQQAVSISLVTVSPDDVERLARGDPWWRGLEAEGVPLMGSDPRNYVLGLRRRRADAPGGGR